MSTAPARSFTRIAVAIVVAAVIISASALSFASFESTVTKTSVSTQISTSTLTTTSTLVSTETVTTTSTATCVNGALNAANAFDAFQAPLNQSVSTNDCQVGITLGLSAGFGVSAGQNESVTVSLTNDLSTARHVNYTGYPELPHGVSPSLGAGFDYTLPLQPPCGSEPAAVAIYNSSGAPLQLSHSPPAIIECIYSPSYQYDSFNASETIPRTLSVGGYWTSNDASQPWNNATYSQFSPGNYTVVAFDLWGQLTELNFTVTATSASPANQAVVVIPSGFSASPNSSFDPATSRVVIGVNNTIVFVNDDKLPVNIGTISWPGNSSGFEDIINAGQNWTVKLTVPGTYTYLDEFHPGLSKGTIVVEPLPLQLRVNLNDTIIKSGEAITATISLFNPLGVNVSVFPDYQSNSAIFSWNSHDFLCGGLTAANPTWSLAGYALFQGHYTAANLSSAAAPLNLDPPLVIECPAEANPSTVTLLPDSGSAVAYFPPNQNGFPYPPIVRQQAVMNATTETYVYKSGYYAGGPDSLFGYWVGPPGGVFGGGQNATVSSPYFHYFPPGQYTLVVEDMWGGVSYSYFQVTS